MIHYLNHIQQGIGKSEELLPLKIAVVHSDQKLIVTKVAADNDNVLPYISHTFPEKKYSIVTLHFNCSG